MLYYKPRSEATSTTVKPFLLSLVTPKHIQLIYILERVEREKEKERAGKKEGKGKICFGNQIAKLQIVFLSG